MFSEADRTRIAAAVTAAEANSDGEIVTVVAKQSDAYHDVVLHWAVLAMFLVLALAAAMPARLVLLLDRVAGGWMTWTPGELIAILLFALAIVFLLARWIVGIRPVRLALTPPATKARRVRRRALLLFRLATENRTRAKTGVLLYLSLAEHRAEIIADAAIDSRVTPETWGDAMAALIDAVKDGRPGDGMVASVGKIGQVLAEHFPRSPDDTNELPDRLILL
jgi:putative membrane protein